MNKEEFNKKYQDVLDVRQKLQNEVKYYEAIKDDLNDDICLTIEGYIKEHDIHITHYIKPNFSSVLIKACTNEILEIKAKISEGDSLLLKLAKLLKENERR
jgi:hypothetical protein